MKKVLVFVVVIVIILGGFYFFNQKKAVVPAVVRPVTTKPTTPVVTNNTPIELCFAKFGTPNSYGDYDIYTLRMDLTGATVKGELNLLPAESDAKTGEIEGTVSAVDKVMMARTANVKWFDHGDNTSENLKIVFGEGTATIGTSNIHLTDVACLDLIERVNVVGYLKDNISTLSPVKAVLGGTWYVDSETVNLANNSGTVKYEDGHIQEVKNFTYTTDTKGQVTSMKLK